MAVLRKFLIAICSITILFFLVSQSQIAFAQTQSTSLSPDTNSGVPNDLHTFTQSLFLEVTNTLLCQLTGYDFIANNQQCLGVDPSTHKIGYVKTHGLYGELANISAGAISMVDTPPAIHTGTFVSYLADNFGIAKKTYAATTTSPGFAGLQPAFAMWQIFRNAAYAILTIVFIVIGVAIMFRVKIDPRTVMSIENTIPKLIIGLLFITFSYAIAGLLVDFTYVIFYLIYSLLYQAAGLGDQGPSYIGQLQSMDFISATSSIFNIKGAPLCQRGLWCLISGSADVVKGMVYNFTQVGESNPIAILVQGLTWVIFFIPKLLCSVGSWLGNIPVVGGAFSGLSNGIAAVPFIGPLACNGVSTILSLITYLIVFVFLTVAVFSTLFKIWWSLLQAYLFIMINTILAPFYVIAGLLPGSKIGTGQWVREMGTNLTAFPATLFALMLASAFANNVGTGTAITFPFIGNLGTGTGGSFGVLLGLATFLITPKLVEDAKELWKPSKSNLTSALGGAVGGAGGFVGGISKQASSVGLAAKYDITGKANPEGRTGRILQNILK